jgi:hypothetical protein
MWTGYCTLLCLHRGNYTDKKERKFFSYWRKFISLNICAFPHIIWGSPSSYMVLHPIPSEFPFIWGKFGFLFYKCSSTFTRTAIPASPPLLSFNFLIDADNQIMIIWSYFSEEKFSPWISNPWQSRLYPLARDKEFVPEMTSTTLKSCTRRFSRKTQGLKKVPDQMLNNLPQ